MPNDKDRVYIYKTQAMQKYNLTSQQIWYARQLGRIVTKLVPNPSDKKQTSLLIDEDSLCDYLESIGGTRIAETETKLGVIAERRCLICGVEVKPKRTLVGHIPQYCEEHNPSRRRS